MYTNTHNEYNKLNPTTVATEAARHVCKQKHIEAAQHKILMLLDHFLPFILTYSGTYMDKEQSLGSEHRCTHNQRLLLIKRTETWMNTSTPKRKRAGMRMHFRQELTDLIDATRTICILFLGIHLIRTWRLSILSLCSFKMGDPLRNFLGSVWVEIKHSRKTCVGLRNYHWSWSGVIISGIKATPLLVRWIMRCIFS